MTNREKWARAVQLTKDIKAALLAGLADARERGLRDFDTTTCIQVALDDAGLAITRTRRNTAK